VSFAYGEDEGFVDDGVVHALMKDGGVCDRVLMCDAFFGAGARWGLDERDDVWVFWMWLGGSDANAGAC